MAVDLSRPDLVAGVFGAGTMGRGIAQLCAQAGLDTLLFDSRAGAVKEAIAAIDRGLEGLVAKGRMTADTRRAALSRIKPISSFDEAKPAGIVIEAIVEDIAAKRTLFAELEARVAADAIVATNTSSLSVTEVAAGCARPAARCRPAFLQSAAADETGRGDRWLAHGPFGGRGARRFCAPDRQTPIVATDSPGFVVNHAGRAYGPEALRIVANGIASPQEVDTLMKKPPVSGWAHSNYWT